MLGLLFSSGTRGLLRGNKFSPLATSSPCSTFSSSSPAAAAATALALHILPTVFLRLMFRLRDSPLCLHTAFKRHFHAPPQPPARRYRSSIVSLRTRWCRRARHRLLQSLRRLRKHRDSRFPSTLSLSLSLFGVFILLLAMPYDREEESICGLWLFLRSTRHYQSNQNDQLIILVDTKRRICRDLNDFSYAMSYCFITIKLFYFFFFSLWSLIVLVWNWGWRK